MNRTLATIAWLLLAFAAGTDARAAARAWLDRDHIALGNVVNLTIEADGSPGKPDLSALRRDFDVRGIATASQTSIVNGSMRTSTQWSVSLAPKHPGVIDIPAIAVGGDKTAPLRVGVDAPASTGAASPAGTPAAAQAPGGSGPVIVEGSIAPEHPYVGQAMIYTLRLYYAVTLLDASLDVPTPDNGDLRQIGDDQRDSVMVQGHRYDVLERHFLLLPEHSGALHVPAPVFRGRTIPSLNGAFDDEPGTGELRTVGKPVDVQVRARPALAADPWLPAKSLRLSVDPVTAAPHSGEPFSLVVRLAGDGVTAAQLPEIALPAIPGAQVYPEPSSTVEHARGGSVQAERMRRFAIVPEREGALRIPDLELPWWDAVNDRAAVARAGFPAIDVAPGAATPPEAAAASPAAGRASSSWTDSILSTNDPEVRWWKLVALVLAVLLVLSLRWGWRRGRFDPDGGEDDDGEDFSRAPAPELTRALAFGQPVPITRAFCAAASAAAPREAAPGSLGEVAQRLADPAQRSAVLAYDAARWSADGTPSAQALAQLREAFASPPRWIAAASSPASSDGLPPLYPT